VTWRSWHTCTHWRAGNSHGPKQVLNDWKRPAVMEWTRIMHIGQMISYARNYANNQCTFELQSVANQHAAAKATAACTDRCGEEWLTKPDWWKKTSQPLIVNARQDKIPRSSNNERWRFRLSYQRRIRLIEEFKESDGSDVRRSLKENQPHLNISTSLMSCLVAQTVYTDWAFRRAYAASKPEKNVAPLLTNDTSRI